MIMGPTCPSLQPFFFLILLCFLRWTTEGNNRGQWWRWICVSPASSSSTVVGAAGDEGIHLVSHNVAGSGGGARRRAAVAARSEAPPPPLRSLRRPAEVAAAGLRSARRGGPFHCWSPISPAATKPRRSGGGCKLAKCGFCKLAKCGFFSHSNHELEQEYEQSINSHRVLCLKWICNEAELLLGIFFANAGKIASGDWTDWFQSLIRLCASSKDLSRILSCCYIFHSVILLHCHLFII